MPQTGAVTTSRDPSRRHLLALAGLAVAGLAGCGEAGTGQDGAAGRTAATGGSTTASGAPSTSRAPLGTASPSWSGVVSPSDFHSPSGVASAASASASTPSGPPSATASAGPQAGLPARDSIVARYAGARPTVWSESAPGVLQRFPTSQPVVALTFDACGGPRPTSAGCGYDRDLIEVLRKHGARATLFLNERWIAANPGIARELVGDPLFEIGNHGTRHLPLSVSGRSAYKEQGTRDVGEVYDEIAGNRAVLASLTGRAPRFFRPGTAFCDDVAVRIAGDLGCRIAGFAVNGDAGTTFTRQEVIAAVGTARAGDIVISHMNRPEHQTAEGYREALPRLLDRGLRTVTLSEAFG